MSEEVHIGVGQYRLGKVNPDHIDANGKPPTTAFGGDFYSGSNRLTCFHPASFYFLCHSHHRTAMWRISEYLGR